MIIESLTSRRLLAAAVMLAALPLLAAAQAAPRVIEWRKPQKGQLLHSGGDYGQPTDYYAVEVREIRVEGKPVAVSRPFAAAADWAKTLTLKVRNTSGRPISRLRITLTLHESEGERGVTRAAAVFTYPGGDCGDAAGESDRAALKPGEEVELSLRCEGEFCARQLAAIAEASAAHRITRAELHDVMAEFNRFEFWWGLYVPAPSP